MHAKRMTSANKGSAKAVKLLNKYLKQEVRACSCFLAANHSLAGRLVHRAYARICIQEHSVSETIKTDALQIQCAVIWLPTSI